MKTIFKYKLDVIDSQTIELPEDSVVIDVQMQGQELMLWAMVDTSKKNVPMKIRVFGTGLYIPSEVELEHIGTVQDGCYVWHVFIEKIN